MQNGEVLSNHGDQKFFLATLGESSLFEHYNTMFELTQQLKWSIEDIYNRYPFEIEIFEMLQLRKMHEEIEAKKRARGQ